MYFYAFIYVCVYMHTLVHHCKIVVNKKYILLNTL